MPPSPFLLLLLTLSTLAPATAAPASAIFAPYIAASDRHRLSRLSPSASLSHPRPARTPAPSDLAESDARALMLARPHPPTASHNTKKPKPYAQGHTFIPTVNIDTPSHPAPKPPIHHHPVANHNANAPANPVHINPASHPASTSHPPSSSSSSSSPTSASAPHSSAESPPSRPAPHHARPLIPASFSLHTSHIPDRLFGNSTVVPVVAVAALIWLAAVLIRRYATCAEHPRRMGRLLRKRLSAPKDIRV